MKNRILVFMMLIMISSAISEDCDKMEPEICDGMDNDCNGDIDDGIVAPPAELNEGVCIGMTKECKGYEGWVEPEYIMIPGYEPEEESCDSYDNDCDGYVDEDLSEPSVPQLGLCKGNILICTAGMFMPDPYNYEPIKEKCDGLDNDCDGKVDEGLNAPLTEDQHGVCEGSRMVCDAGKWIEPFYSEIPGYEPVEVTCDGIDNDCDGLEDEDLSTLSDNQEGECAGNMLVCEAGILAPSPNNYEPTAEVCEGLLDENCDGQVDEVCNCVSGTKKDCGTDIGDCTAGTELCTDGEWSGVCDGQVTGYDEECDGRDNDCNGLIDDGLIEPDGDKQDGVCVGSKKICKSEEGWVEPPYSEFEGYEETEASCDGIDNDCDGIIDNVDLDNDGVNDCFDDKCPGTEEFFADELKAKHFDDNNWPASPENYGCNCEQVLYCKPGPDSGEIKFGCTVGTRKIWEKQKENTWATECQVDGLVKKGEDKSLLENTDKGLLPDILDRDNDNDGIRDPDDDMREDGDPEGDPDYGVPDWHKTSKHMK